MGARKGSGCQLLWRLFICCATGWFGLDALRLYLKIRDIDVLHDGPYDPNVIPAYLIAGSAGTFLFFWSLLTIPSVMNAHGGALIVLSTVDSAAIIAGSVALGLQSHFLPHAEGQCASAASWQVSEGTPSLFDVLMDSVNIKNKYDPTRVCLDRTKSWRWGIAVMVSFGFISFCNICSGIRELGRSSCYWMYDHKGNRQKWSRKDMCMSFPLYIIEHMLELSWRLVPTRIRLRHRYTQRHDVRRQRVRKYEKVLKKEIGSELITRLRTGQHPALVPTIAVPGSNVDNEKAPNLEILGISEKVSLHNNNSSELAEKSSEGSPESIFNRLPWHLIVNDILPYFHHVDIVNLLTTSRSTYKAIIPNDATDRAVVFLQACQTDDISTYSMISGTGITPVYCFGCAIPVCKSCSQGRMMAESPSTVHSRTCRAVCSTCFRSHLSQKSRYHNRKDLGPCVCAHNTLIVAPEPLEEPPVENEDPRPLMACWSILGHGGVIPRVLCSQCITLSNVQVKKKREDRYRKHRTIVRDVEGPGNKQAYECSQCHTLQHIADKKKPVMFFLCQQCHKECRYNKHDMWLVGDVYRRQAQRLLPPNDCIISIDEVRDVPKSTSRQVPVEAP